MGQWRVQKVTETEGSVTAELRQVSWFKRNPEWEATADQTPAPDPSPDEFVDCEPDEEGAEFFEIEGRMTLVITEGPEMHAGDNVFMEYRVLGPPVLA